MSNEFCVCGTIGTGGNGFQMTKLTIDGNEIQNAFSGTNLGHALNSAPAVLQHIQSAVQEQNPTMKMDFGSITNALMSAATGKSAVMGELLKTNETKPSETTDAVNPTDEANKPKVQSKLEEATKNMEETREKINALKLLPNTDDNRQQLAKLNGDFETQ